MPDDFFDTNVLVYLASSDPAKAERVEAIVSEGGTISVQVLNEFANVARRKMRLPWNETRILLATLRALLRVNPLTVEMHEAGLALAERYNLSIYDAMIVASALHANSKVLWSEDMQNGMTIERRLRIVNPFLSAKSK